MNIYRGPYRFGLGTMGLPQAVKTLMLANVCVFLLQVIVNRLASPVLVSIPGDSTTMQGLGHIVPIQRMDSWFALVPRWVISQARVWQLFTYMFLHGNVLHIFINMLFLWVFGSELERIWGPRQFVRFYLTCGVGAALFHLVFRFSSVIPVVGASGAIYGLLMAYGMLFPDRIITLFLFFVLPIQMKAKYLVLIFGGLSVLGGIGSLFGNEGGVAYLAHLGGMAVGYFYVKRSLSLARVLAYVAKKQRERRVAAEARRSAEVQRLRDEVDSLLDKINEVGYENLSPKEKKLLKEASRFLSQE